MEREILRIIYGPCRDINTNERRRRHNSEEQVYGKENIASWIKSNRLSWKGQVVRRADQRIVSSVFWENSDEKPPVTVKGCSS